MSIFQGQNMIAGSGGGGIANYDGKSITENAMEEIQTIGVISARDNTTAIKVYPCTKAQYDAIVTKDPNTLYNITDDYNVTDIRTLGQIVQSTIPLVDAGLHLLDGSVIAYGSYKAFVDYMAGLVSDYPDLFTSEASWQQSVTDYGVCGKFVYDSVSKTVRLPKYSNKIYSALPSELGVKGNGMTLGLTDGTNNFGIYSGSVGGSPNVLSNSTNLYGESINTLPTGTYLNTKSVGITLDHTKSGIIADLSNITTALDGYYYIVIATATKTEIEVDIDEIATDLNGKADTDLSNVLSNIDYVVESQLPTADNNYTWYRKYKSGWLEQGGIQSDITSSYTTINLIKTYADINYFLSAQTNEVFTGSQMAVCNITSESSFQVKYSGSGTAKICWEAKGMGA